LSKTLLALNAARQCELTSKLARRSATAIGARLRKISAESQLFAMPEPIEIAAQCEINGILALLVGMCGIHRVGYTG
jgi:hypothetical protein